MVFFGIAVAIDEAGETAATVWVGTVGGGTVGGDVVKGGTVKDCSCSRIC